MERKRRARDGWMACDEGSETRETRVSGKTDGTRRRARAQDVRRRHGEGGDDVADEVWITGEWEMGRVGTNDV